MTPTDRTAEIDADLRNLVEGAFPETTVDVIAEEVDAAPAYRSIDAEAAWKRMHDAAQGREIAVLLEMLEGTWLTGEERWKAVTFLGYTLRTPEAQPQREQILQALAIEAIVKQRGSGAGDAVRIQGAALEAVAASPLDANAKWQFMLDAVQGSRSYFREILRLLSAFRPPEATAAADAHPILLDAMVRSDRVVDLDSVARLVRELDVRSAKPDLRRLLLAANSHLSARVAPILADWGDTEAAFEVRRAINQYSTASDTNVDDLIDALYRLEGPGCGEFVAEVFRTAPPALQEHLLDHSLRGIPSAAVASAARELAASTRDVDLKKAAEAYLDAAPAPAAEEEPAATVASTATPDSADAGWQPVYEGTSTAAPKPAPAPTPAPATPVPAAPAPAASAPSPAPAPSSSGPDAPAGSWQPAYDDPQASNPVADEARSRRLGVEAEALALIRQEAEAARLAAEELAAQQAGGPSGPDPLEFLVRLPQILFALAVIGALLVLILNME